MSVGRVPADPVERPDDSFAIVGALAELRKHAVHVVDLAALLPVPVASLINTTALKSLLDDSDGAHVPLAMVDVFRVGLDPRLLACVRAYLDTPPALTAVHVRRDVGRDVTDDLTCWHVDAEDARMLRLIVYLCHVDEGNGPFEYIPLAHGDRCAPLLGQAVGDLGSNPDYDPVCDDVMAAHVDPSLWKAATGPPYRSVLVDTARVFHRTRPHDAERVALTFSYTSRTPRFPLLRRSDRLDGVLDGEQADCLFIDHAG